MNTNIISLPIFRYSKYILAAKGYVMIKDRRHSNHLIPIFFNAKETFNQYPNPDRLTMTLITDGTWILSLNKVKHHFKAPIILCLNPNDTFCLENSSNAAAKTFIFDVTFLNSSLTKQALMDNHFEKIEDMHDRNLVQAFFLRNEHYTGLLPLNAPSAMQINTWLSIIGSECFSQSDSKWTCRIRRYLLQILYLLEDEFLLYYGGNSRKQAIDYALEYIHSNYNLGLTLDGISKYVGLNRTSLNKHCKQTTGMTIIQYLNNYRIKMSEDALRHTNLNLNEIAICCGYNYESYFIKIFTDKHGISPTEYRKLYHG